MSLLRTEVTEYYIHRLKVVKSKSGIQNVVHCLIPRSLPNGSYICQPHLAGCADDDQGAADCETDAPWVYSPLNSVDYITGVIVVYQGHHVEVLSRLEAISAKDRDWTSQVRPISTLCLG